MLLTTSVEVMGPCSNPSRLDDLGTQRTSLNCGEVRIPRDLAAGSGPEVRGHIRAPSITAPLTAVSAQPMMPRTKERCRAAAPCRPSP